MVQWLGLCTLTANGRGSICSQGTKISQLHTVAKNNNNNNNKGGGGVMVLYNLAVPL